MLDVKGRSVIVHRGDAGSFIITFTEADAPEDGVEVLFSIKGGKEDDAPVLLQRTLTVADHEIQIDISREDSRKLGSGTFYWDLCIMWPNLPWTPMDPEPFIVKRVVHDVS